MNSEIDDKVPIIIEFGSYNTRVGFANESSPRLVLQPCLQRIKHPIPWAIGKEISSTERLRPRTVRMLFTSDTLTNFVMVESFLDRVFYDLGFKTRIKNPIIVSETMCCPLVNRALLTDLLFGNFQISKLCFVSSPLTAAFHLKHEMPSDGLIINAGHSVTHVIFIKGGIMVPYISQRIPIGGNAMFTLFVLLLRSRAVFLDFLLSEDDLYNLMFKAIKTPSSYEKWRDEIDPYWVSTIDPKMKIKTDEELVAIKERNSARRERLMNYRAKIRAEKAESDEKKEEVEDLANEEIELQDSQNEDDKKKSKQSYALKRAQEARKSKYLEAKTHKEKQREWRLNHPQEYIDELNAQAKVNIEKYEEIKFRLRESREKMQTFCTELGLHQDDDPLEFLLNKLHEINEEIEEYGGDLIEIPSVIDGFVNEDFCYALRVLLHLDPQHDNEGKLMYPLLWERVAPVEMLLNPGRVSAPIPFEEMSSLSARAAHCKENPRKEFRPSGLIEVLENAFKASDFEYRAKLAKNIFFTGGVFKTEGLVQRVKDIITPWIPQNVSPNFIVPCDFQLATYNGMQEFSKNDNIWFTPEDMHKMPQGWMKEHMLSNPIPFDNEDIIKAAIQKPAVKRGQSFSLTVRKSKAASADKESTTKKRR